MSGYFEIGAGRPGNGKSLYAVKQIGWLLYRNKKWFDKTGKVRQIATNIKLSPEFEKRFLYKGKNFLSYFTTIHQVLKLRDCDLVWDEISTEFDARDYSGLSMECKRFLSQYRKRGIEIYANTQHFGMVDLRARTMVTRLYEYSKWIGSRDPSPTKPPPWFVWGVCFGYRVLQVDRDDPYQQRLTRFPRRFFFIRKQDIERYDTRQDILKSEPLPFIHEERKCEKPDCNFCKTIHR